MRLRDRIRKEIGDAILSAAETVIGENGLQGASMERIAAVAGVSVGTLYNHFQDRDAMLDALRESRVSFLRERIDSVLEAARGQPLREQLRAFLSAIAAHGREHGRFFAALIQEQMGPVRLRPPARAGSALLSASSELLARGVAAGELREDPGGLHADALVALARLLLVRTVEGAGGEAENERLTELFIQGAGR